MAWRALERYNRSRRLRAGGQSWKSGRFGHVPSEPGRSPYGLFLVALVVVPGILLGMTGASKIPRLVDYFHNSDGDVEESASGDVKGV